MAVRRILARHFRCLWATVVGTLLLAAAAIAIVDPYNLHPFVDARGFNHIKPSPDRHQFEIKLSGARRVGADVLILGNSRAEIGFDPTSSALAEPGHSVYNLALAGTAIGSSARLVERLAADGQRPAVAIIGLEFLDFLGAPDEPAPAPTYAGHASWRWRVDLSFSLASLLDAAKTLRMQNDPDAATLTDRGLNPLREYPAMARRDGYFVFFEQRARENADRLVRKPKTLVPHRGSDWTHLTRLVDTLVASGAEIHLVIYPYHAQTTAMFEGAGLWATFTRWKQELASFADERGDRRVRLWDFSGFDGARCEPIPARGDTRTIPAWYWEAGHFKTALGDEMLSVIRGHAGPGDALDFTNLSKDTVAASEARIAAGRARCLAENPAVIASGLAHIEAARARAGAEPPGR